jgi:L-threonylcarbamoyladenylate synthase
MILPDTATTRQKAAQLITDGGVIAFRTDTFYGLGVDPINAQAVMTIRELKGREETKPILLLVADRKDVDRFIASPSETFKIVAEHFWPGPLTIVGRAHAELPAELTAGTETIGVRLPDDEQVRELVRICGGALTATSANRSGEPPARTAQEVASCFPTGLDLVLDSGEVTAVDPSTVLDLSGPVARLIREGAISKKELREVIELF